MNEKNKPISIREYARRRGCSDTAVRKAIAQGHIKPTAIETKAGKVQGIYADLADAQWAKTYKPALSRNPKLAERLTPDADDMDQVPDAVEAPTGRTMKGGADVATAQKFEAVYKAKLRELEYKKKSGELVSKSGVYRALFAAGQEIRTQFQAIPDRVIDDILAADTRNRAHTILAQAIDEVLQAVAELPNRPIAPNV